MSGPASTTWISWKSDQKWSWRASILRRSKRFKRNHRQHSRLSRKLDSGKFSRREKQGGTDALQRRGTTSTVTDLAHCDFGLFPHVKIKLKDFRFETIEEIQKESQAALQAVTETTFWKIFQQRKTGWDRCITAQGNNFQTDGNIRA